MRALQVYGNSGKSRGSSVNSFGMKRWVVIFVLAGFSLAVAQAKYEPKFKGDPAHSDSEAIALGYMRTTLRAQKLYKEKNNHYATSLAQLIHVGSFTKRMANPNRGDYTVGFHSHKDGFELLLTPQAMDEQHRSFFANEDGVIHGDFTKPADAGSPVVK